MTSNAANVEATITMLCPNLSCGQTVIAPISARGKVVRCAFCNQPFRVPDAPPPPAPVNEPAKPRRTG